MGTTSITAESRTAVEASIDSQSGRFQTLKRELDQCVQSRIAEGYWEERAFESSYSDDFLAVSWRGGVGYWKALAWRKKLAALEKNRAALPKGVRSDREREIGSATRLIHDRFAPKRAGPYAVELFVFFKTANLAPAALVQMAPDCVPAFMEAPLHTHFLIRRQQSAVDQGEALRFGGFDPLAETPRDGSALCKLFLSLAFPKEAPPITDEPEPRCLLCILLALAAIALLGIAATILLVPDWRDSLFRALDIGRRSEIVRLDEELANLQEEYDRVLARAQAPDVALDTSRVEMLERELDRLASQLAEHGQDVPARTLPLGVPPCLPVVATMSAGGGAPGYIYAVTLGAGGIRLSEPAGVHALSASDLADPDFPVTRPMPQEVLSIDAFEALVSPISQAARAAYCAHYVLLRDGETNDREGYIAQRSAVERHFYVYRPSPQ
ncbi:hypothetical protein [Maricaulis sp.]|uniref:hypothetical protein n=1 Tax=Maricaulis sp. TaxID=1486257 RepID=UPI0025BEBD8A|nr:hypothetical protein [Maricaulis sp.]